MHEALAQTYLIRPVFDAVRRYNYPVCVFCGSRAEPHLSAAFKEPRFAELLRTVSLEGNDPPDDEIRCFTYELFAHIFATRHLSKTLDAACPRALP